MQMEVWHGLARRRAVIDANVVPVRTMFRIDGSLCLVEEFQKGRALGSTSVEERADVTLRDDEAMPR